MKRRMTSRSIDRAGASAALPGPAVIAAAPPSLRGELRSMVLLLVLYFLQGIPIGLASALPMLLAARGAS